MDRPLAAIWTDEAMEMAMLAHLRRGVMAVVVPLRATLAIIDVTRRIVRPGLDTRRIAQGFENHGLAALGKDLLAKQSFADGLLPVFVHVRPTGAAPRKVMLRRVQQWALRHKGIPVPALRSMGSRRRREQRVPQSMARPQRKEQRVPQSTAKRQRKGQPVPQSMARRQRMGRPVPQSMAGTQRREQPELQSTARRRRMGQPVRQSTGRRNRVSKQRRVRQSMANMLSTD